MEQSTLKSLSGNNGSYEKYEAFMRTSQEGIWLVELEKPISTKLPIKKQLKLMYEYAYLAATPGWSRGASLFVYDSPVATSPGITRHVLGDSMYQCGDATHVRSIPWV